MKYLCEPCDHKWYQHRHPNPLMRHIGMAMMAIGAFQIFLGVYFLVTG